MANNISKNIKTAVVGLIKPVSSRNRDIVSRRFGLNNGKIETLESIGRTYGITRERVRQIEEYSLKNLKAELAKEPSGAKVKPYFDFVHDALKTAGGFMAEPVLFEKFSGQPNLSVINASLVFLLTLNSDFLRGSENDDLIAFWHLNDGSDIVLADAVKTTVSVLQETKSLMPREELYEAYKSGAKSGAVSLPAFLSALEISKNIGKNIFHQHGLVEWAEIRPRGVRDRAYLVLKKEIKPRHFREITDLINGAKFSVKRANVQTVHNELIKDERFVLVGRGIYGLAEWGYRAGTVKDVLVDILKESNRALSKEELVAKVLASRYVKENTVLLNLQDSKVFAKKGDGTYILREA